MIHKNVLLPQDVRPFLQKESRPPGMIPIARRATPPLHIGMLYTIKSVLNVLAAVTGTGFHDSVEV